MTTHTDRESFRALMRDAPQLVSEEDVDECVGHSVDAVLPPGTATVSFEWFVAAIRKAADWRYPAETGARCCFGCVCECVCVVC